MSPLAVTALGNRHAPQRKWTNPAVGSSMHRARGWARTTEPARGTKQPSGQRSVTPADGSAFRLARAGEGHLTAAVCTLASPGTCVPRELAAGTASRALPPSPKTRSGSCPASPPAEALYLILFYLSLRVSSERPLTAPTHSTHS